MLVARLDRHDQRQQAVVLRAGAQGQALRAAAAGQHVLRAAPHGQRAAGNHVAWRWLVVQQRAEGVATQAQVAGAAQRAQRAARQAVKRGVDLRRGFEQAGVGEERAA